MVYTGRTSRTQRAIERQFGKPWTEVLDLLLLDQRLSHEQAALRLGVARATVSTWEMWRRAQRNASAAATSAVA